MEYDFNYLIEKINLADFSSSPFKHIYIENFIAEEHFEKIVNSPEIRLKTPTSDEELFVSLFEVGYKIVEFPGCITNKEKYISWHSGNKNVRHHSACEGFGITLRLYDPTTPILKDLKAFLASPKFNECLAKKFGLKISDYNIDGGIQKYLDGYEISPHPDIRLKAATFMVNINPSARSEKQNHHTHYMKFNEDKKFVQTYWEGNPKVDRRWVPWHWCTTIFQQTKNNSIVIFSPENDTLHAVKASYDHLATQRTQLYGNLWFKEDKTESSLEWEDFDLTSEGAHSKSFNLKKMIPNPIKARLKNVAKYAHQRLLRQDDDIGDRQY